MLQVKARVALEPCNESGAGLLDAMPPAIVAVAFIEHIQRPFLQRHFRRQLHVVDVSCAKAVPLGRRGGSIEQHMYLDTLRVARAVVLRPAIKLAPLERERSRVQQVHQLRAVPALLTRDLPH